MLCDECAERPIDVIDGDGYGFCMECFAELAVKHNGNHPIAAYTDPEIKEAIIEIIQDAMIDALTNRTIRGIHSERGNPLSVSAVRQATAELIDEGRTELLRRSGVPADMGPLARKAEALPACLGHPVGNIFV